MSPGETNYYPHPAVRPGLENSCAIMLSCGFPATFLLLPGSREGLVYQPSCGLNSIELHNGEEKPALQPSHSEQERGMQGVQSTSREDAILVWPTGAGR